MMRLKCGEEVVQVRVKSMYDIAEVTNDGYHGFRKEPLSDRYLEVEFQRNKNVFSDVYRQPNTVSKSQVLLVITGDDFRLEGVVSPAVFRSQVGYIVHSEGPWLEKIVGPWFFHQSLSSSRLSYK